MTEDLERMRDGDSADLQFAAATRCSLAFPHSYHSPSLPSTSTSTSSFSDSFHFHSIFLTSPLYVVYEILFIYPFIVRSLYLFSPPPRPYIIIIVDIESHKTSRWETVALNKRQIEYRQIDRQTNRQTDKKTKKQADLFSMFKRGVSRVYTSFACQIDHYFIVTTKFP